MVLGNRSREPLKFVDKTKIRVISGNGGRGCLSFRREPYVPKGGPDGGDGGKGGDVYLIADPALNTLLDCQYQQLYRAGHGRHGMGKNKQGRSAPDVSIRVPVGTVVRDSFAGELIVDLDEPGRRVLVARGGRGGRGNARFATPRNRAPRQFEEGEPGEEKTLTLELKLIADVGLVGLPNSGKSTLLAQITNARPEVGAYPFTTKRPNLGVVKLDGEHQFIVADIPGLIEDAHKGAGMGYEFLRHVERTRMLLHLIDPDPESSPDIEAKCAIITKELRSFNEELVRKPSIVILTKIDVSKNREAARLARIAFEQRGIRVREISALSGEGLDDLVNEIAHTLQIRATRDESGKGKT